MRLIRRIKKSINNVAASVLIRPQNAKYFRNTGGLKIWKCDLLRFGWFNLLLDPFFKEIMNLQTKMPDLACRTRYIQNGDRAPGAGGVTSSDWDHSTCIWTQFLRRFWICGGKFEILTVAPNMDKSVMDIGKKWPPLFGMVQLVFRPNFWGDSESKEGTLKFSP
jgi:hypothetical protein